MTPLTKKYHKRLQQLIKIQEENEKRKKVHHLVTPSPRLHKAILFKSGGTIRRMK